MCECVLCVRSLRCSAAHLNPFTAPCLPLLPHIPLPRATTAPPADTPSVADGDKRRKRRRLGDVGVGAHTASRSRHLVHDTLGCHVPQLLHILQLKDSITQQHRTLLHAAIASKRRRNDAILEQQRIEVAARQQRKQLATTNAQTSASDSMTDVQPTAAATTDTAAAQPIPTSSSATDPPPPAHPLLLPSPADFAALTFPNPPSSYYNESQMLTLLPSVVAVHLLHCGFSSFPRSALSVLSEATIDFIRRAGVALREAQDDTKAKRRSRHRVKATSKGGSGVEGRRWLTQRLLRSLGLSDVRPLQRFFERALVKAGERIRQTEERLIRTETVLRRQQPDTVLQMGSDEVVHNSSNGGRVSSSWLCEPFSPLRSFVQPPAMPKTPPPLEEEEVEEQPPPAVSTTTSNTSSSTGEMAVEPVQSGVHSSAQTNESSASGASEQLLGTGHDEQPRESTSTTTTSDEQAAALPPLESVDGLLTSQSAPPMQD